MAGRKAGGRVELPGSVLLMGRRWRLRKYTKEELKDRESFGECNFATKELVFHPKQHPEELIDTIVHEGIHAVAAQGSNNPTLHKLATDEDAVHLLAGELCGLLKQTMRLELKEA